MSNKNEVAKKEENEVLDLSQFEGMESGFEGADSSVFKTPFMKILQKTNPEVDPDETGYIEGAKAGTFMNTATKELTEELNVIVLKIQSHLMVWKPNREGLVGNYDKSEEKNIVAKREGAKKWDIDGNEIEDTLTFFCLNANNPSELFAFPLSRSSYKYGRSFATKIRYLKMNGKAVNVTWAGVWNLKVTTDKNDQGKWFTVGDTASFSRFVTAEEVNEGIKPASEILKTAETNYEEIKETDSVEKDTEDF